jgi:hypothetical protein
MKWHGNIVMVCSGDIVVLCHAVQYVSLWYKIIPLIFLLMHILGRIWGFHGGDKEQCKSSQVLRRVAIVRTDVSQERIFYIIRGKIIGELRTTLAVTSNPSTMRRNTILSPWWWRRHAPPKGRFLQEPYGVTSKKTAFFIVTAVKASNLT